MKQEKTQGIQQIIMICILGLVINWSGKWLATITHAPLWLDSLGTCMVGFLYGPVAGMFCGLFTNLVYGILDHIALVYALTGSIIGFLIGYYAKKGYYKDAFSTVTSSLTVGIACVVVSTPLNLIFWNGKSGNVWGDALFDMLSNYHVPKVICAVMGEAFIDIPDKILTLSLLYMFACFYNKRKKNQQNKAGHKLSCLFATFISASLAFGLLMHVDVKAEEIDISDYVKIVYNSNNKMASSEANVICQTPDGYIWVGSYAGLYRYDGTHFRMVGLEDSITNVTSLYVDSKGRLLVGTNDSGVAIYEDGEFRLFGINEGLAANSVRSIGECENGDYYIGTTGFMSILHTDNSCETLESKAQEEQVTFVIDLTDETEGVMAGVTNEGKAFFLNDGEITEVFDTENEHAYYTCIYRTENGTYLMGTNADYMEEVRCKNGNLQRIRTIEVPGLSTIHDITTDNSGTIWICGDDGFGYLNKNYALSIMNYKPFSSSLEKVIQDYEGNYWFASSRLGLLELTKNSFVDIYNRVNHEEEVVNSVCLYHGLLYVGTDSGLTIIDEKNRKYIENELTERMKGVRIRCLMEDSDNKLWISTYGAEGLVCVNEKDEVIELDPKVNPPEGGRVRSTLEMEDGTLVVAKNTGLTFIQNGKVVNTITEEDGLKNPQILSLCETYDHGILAGSDGEGIFLIKDGEIVKQITYDNGLSSQVIMRIVPYKNGYFLVSSNGLCYMDQAYNVRLISNFPYANNLDLRIMDDDNVWVLSSTGVFIVAADSLYHNVEGMSYRLLGSQQGLSGAITSNSWNYMSEDGWLYISCSGGVNKINVDYLQNYKSDYLLGLNSVSAESGTLKADRNGVYQLDPLDRKIVLEPVVLDYTLSNPYVRYYMQDFDEQEVIIRQNELTNIVYTNLQSGKYTFHFDVLDENTMQPIKGMTVVLNKEKQFYEHVWFYGYLIFIILFVVAYITWVLTHISNMSLIKEQYNEIRLARDEAERANQTKSMFLANMSHEIRTPMTAIIGMTQIALKDDISDTVREYLNNILSAGQKLLYVINDILDFSKIESGKMDIVVGEYSLSALVGDVKNIVRFRLEDKPITLIVKEQENMPDQLIGDEVRIRQIMINLLNNAVKYTNEGTITFKIGYQNENSSLCFEVADTGCGIRKDDLARLFESFERVETDGLHSVEGTGLGLTICKSLLDLMEGTIEVESEFGKGTKFSVVVPQKVVNESVTYQKAKETGLRESSVKSQTKQITFKGAKILIVDDNEMNLKVAKGLLRNYDMQIDCATSGWQCMDVVKKTEYDLILLDHVMPQIDGIETLHRLQADTRFHVPVVALTANALNGAKDAYLKEGFADYLSKPMEQDEVEAVLKKFLKDFMAEQSLSVQEKHIVSTPIVNQELKLEKTQMPSQMQTAVDKQQKKNASTNSLFVFLNEEGINTESGLRYMGGSREQYVEILKLFISEAADKIAKLDVFLQAHDMEGYGILVHAMKSNARSIGADALADLAFELEKAAKAGDEAFVEANHKTFVLQWKLLVAGIKYIPQLMQIDEMIDSYSREDEMQSAVTSEGEAQAEMSSVEETVIIDEKLLHRFEETISLLDDFEMDAAKEYLEAMEKEEWPKIVKACIEKAKKAVLDFEYDEAIELLNDFVRKHRP